MTGAFGEVYKGKWNKLDVAVKRLLVRLNNDETINSFLKEVSMLGYDSHHRIITSPSYTNAPISIAS
jgi:serine/threonine protein kinase